MPDTSIKMTLRRWTLSDKQMEEITVLSGPQKEEIHCEINALGLLTFDVSQLEEENKERYFQLIINEIGSRVQLATTTPTFTRGGIKPASTNPISTRRR